MLRSEDPLVVVSGVKSCSFQPAVLWRCFMIAGRWASIGLTRSERVPEPLVGHWWLFRKGDFFTSVVGGQRRREDGRISHFYGFVFKPVRVAEAKRREPTCDVTRHPGLLAAPLRGHLRVDQWIATGASCLIPDDLGSRRAGRRELGGAACQDLTRLTVKLSGFWCFSDSALRASHL